MSPLTILPVAPPIVLSAQSLNDVHQIGILGPLQDASVVLLRLWDVAVSVSREQISKASRTINGEPTRAPLMEEPTECTQEPRLRPQH